MLQLSYNNIDYKRNMIMYPVSAVRLGLTNPIEIQPVCLCHGWCQCTKNITVQNLLQLLEIFEDYNTFSSKTYLFCLISSTSHWKYGLYPMWEFRSMFCDYRIICNSEHLMDADILSWNMFSCAHSYLTW